MSEALREILEGAYTQHHSQYSKGRDPLSLVHAFTDPRDQEVAGFLTALLSYGSVPIILGSAKKVLGSLGPAPSRGLLAALEAKHWESFRHRFTTGDDIEIVLHWLHTAVESHGTLENYFIGDQPRDLSMRDRLSDFVTRFTTQELPPRLQQLRAQRERQLKYLISDPLRGSACKRLNMFLRWMVRPEDGIDLGIWKRLSPKDLVLPIDTHLLQTIRHLGWTKSNQASWKLAELATQKLKLYCPEDPIKYDFALCHLSMEGGKLALPKRTNARSARSAQQPKARAGESPRGERRGQRR